MSLSYSLSSDTEFDTSNLDTRTQRENNKREKEYYRKKSLNPLILKDEFEIYIKSKMKNENLKNINNFINFETLKFVGVCLILFGMLLLIFFCFPIFVVSLF